MTQGSPTDILHVLLDGEASSVLVTSVGRSVTLARWLAPVVIDKVTMFSESRHPASVPADTPVTWCTLPFPLVRSSIDASPPAQRHALSELAVAAREAREAFVDTALRPSRARLARWLVVTTQVGVRPVLPAPQERLASQLGMTRMTLNRSLHALIADRLIDLDGSIVTIRDMDRLRQLADLRDPRAGTAPTARRSPRSQDRDRHRGRASTPAPVTAPRSPSRPHDRWRHPHRPDRRATATKTG